MTFPRQLPVVVVVVLVVVASLSGYMFRVWQSGPDKWHFDNPASVSFVDPSAPNGTNTMIGVSDVAFRGEYVSVRRVDGLVLLPLERVISIGNR